MPSYKVNTMLIGAGEAGVELLNDILRHQKSPCRVVCIIDDAPEKWGKEICGVPVVGGRETIHFNVNKYAIDTIVLAIPSADAHEKKDILERCHKTSCRLRTLPPLYQFADPCANIRLVRDVNLEDLLGRDPSDIDLSQISRHVAGKTVLVTGAGGSIGSELCRQLATYDIKQLIMLDCSENGIYKIQQELLSTQISFPLEVLVGSIRDQKRLEYVFSTFRPNIIFHAAAHKHVPLMEESPHEAIKNNVFGTSNLVSLADKHQVENFLLISTDKAVNPTNIMGASKRICELLIQKANSHSKTEFVAVRFGNVLGSNGSVIPLFQRQIAVGGPVTVTSPKITRFFMTIPEAVSLVLTAGALARGGEIFVLDMGEPVKIIDMARQLIRLSGYTPDDDIKIVFNGLRPGEKLYEELLMNEEELKKTENKKIYIESPTNFDKEIFAQQLQELSTIINDETSDIRSAIAQIVPTYNPSAREN